MKSKRFLSLHWKSVHSKPWFVNESDWVCELQLILWKYLIQNNYWFNHCNISLFAKIRLWHNDLNFSQFLTQIYGYYFHDTFMGSFSTWQVLIPLLSSIILLFSTEERKSYMFETLRWVNDDRIVIFGWTTSLLAF